MINHHQLTIQIAFQFLQGLKSYRVERQEKRSELDVKVDLEATVVLTIDLDCLEDFVVGLETCK